jgi:hypothetical protein
VRLLIQHPQYENFKPQLLSSLYPKPGGAYIPVYRDNISFYNLLSAVLPKDLPPSLLAMSSSPRPEALSFMTPGVFTEDLFLAWKAGDPLIEKPR